MAKADIELMKMVLKRNGLEDRLVADIIKEIQQETSSDKDDDKPKDGKFQYVVMVYDPEGALNGKEFTGTVCKIPEENSVYVLAESLHKAGYEYNTTKKGRRMPVKTMGEICEHVPAKILKEFGVKVMHKEPCFLMATDGLLPTEATNQHIDKRKAQ